MRKKQQQKLVSFTDNVTDLTNIEKDMKDGWNIVSLTSNGNHYIGIMEKLSKTQDASVFIPARKKIKIIS